MRRSLVALLAVLTALPGSADESSRTSAVTIDFSVIGEDGRPVVDLRAHEVRLVDGERVTPLSELRFVGELQEPPGGSTSEPRAASRVIAFLLDEYHVRPEASAGVRAALSDFIERHIKPSDQLIVLKPPESLITLQLASPQHVLDVVAAFEGRKGDFSPRTSFERDYLASDALRVEVARTQLTLSALQSLAFHVGRTETGRKAIVVVSEGFATAPRRGREALPSIESVLRASSASGVTFYAVDPRALVGAVSRPEPQPSRERDGRSEPSDLLGRLAAETSGVMARRSEEVPAAWRRLVEDLAGYYVGTFSGASDGRFHPLQLRVTRPGTRVRARRGYWARFREDTWTAGTPISARGAADGTGIGSMPVLRASRLVQPWFGLSRGTPGTTRVTFVWEPVLPTLGERTRTLPVARVALTAYRADGREVFRAHVRPTGSGHGPEPAAAFFDVPPGRLRVQMAIEDAAARLIDTDVRDVLVAPLGSSLALGTPSVVRTRTARDRRAAAADVAAPPSVSREFTRREHLLIRFPVYANGAVTVTATLLGRSGRALRPLSVARRGETELYELDMPLAPFAIGEYAVQLTASRGSESVQELVSLRVVP